MNRTSIEWTHRPETGGPRGGFTWNPIRARFTDWAKELHALSDHDLNRTGTFCTRISPGCKNCYASTINKRFGTGLEYTVPNLASHEFFIDDRILQEPLKRKKPATIFVGDMFDLFHEAIPTEFVAEVLRVAIKTPRHTFQFLTKRADRMKTLVTNAQNLWEQSFPEHMWFGVSVEDQQRADERIPRLQETPAAVRFLSVEPLLEHVTLGCDTPELGWVSYLRGIDGVDPVVPGIDWVIVGGESGPGARPFNLSWAEYLLRQCKAANVPFFMKQLGSKPQVHACRNESCTHPGCGMEDIRQRDRKGGDPSEWPEHLRVREFPR